MTGRPVPPPATDVAAARARFGLAEGEPCVLVFGGSLGARSINEAAIVAFAGAPYRVLHAAGTRDFAALRERVPPGGGYDLREYIHDFGEALLATDLASRARAGRSSRSPRTGARRSSSRIRTRSADHQTANARWMADAGAAVVVADAELTPERLRAEVDGLLADPARLAGDGPGVGRAGAAGRGSADRGRAAGRGGRVSVALRHVGACGHRAQEDRADHEDRGGQRTPAVGTNLHICGNAIAQRRLRPLFASIHLEPMVRA